VVSPDPAAAPAFSPPMRLKVGSPAIDVGNHSFNGQPLDLGQQPRIQGLAIDMGAFEATPAPHLEVHKSASSVTVKVGEVVTYTYEVINTGAITLTALSATDDKLGAVNLGVSELAPLASVSIALATMAVEGDLPGPLVNTATVTGTSALSGTVVATDTASVSISYRPRLAVTMAPSVNSALPGTTVTYTVQVQNTGDVNLTAVAATDDRLGAVALNATTLAPGATAMGTLAYTVQSSDLPGPLVDTVTGVGVTPLGRQVKGQDLATVAVIEPTPPVTIYLPIIRR
ncbi:MAG: hypothetical protein KAX65_00330, partial [Caldilineaceae bacterium]|nr:hypothetical protein [Caldilineaceae bacterium]